MFILNEFPFPVVIEDHETGEKGDLAVYMEFIGVLSKEIRNSLDSMLGFWWEDVFDSDTADFFHRVHWGEERGTLNIYIDPEGKTEIYEPIIPFLNDLLRKTNDISYLSKVTIRLPSV